MRIVALSLLALWTLTLAGCESKAEKVKKLQDQYNAEIPGLRQGLSRSGDRRIGGSSDGKEADARRDRSPSSQEEGTRSTVQAAGRPSCAAPERDSRCTAVKPYRCKASRSQRR